MSKWKDISSYSQNGPREVTSVELTVGDLRLVVTRKIHCEGWWMCIFPLGTTQRLGSKGLEFAKAEALDALRAWVQRINKCLADIEEDK